MILQEGLEISLACPLMPGKAYTEVVIKMFCWMAEMEKILALAHGGGNSIQTTLPHTGIHYL